MIKILKKENLLLKLHLARKAETNGEASPDSKIDVWKNIPGGKYEREMKSKT